MCGGGGGSACGADGSQATRSPDGSVRGGGGVLVAGVPGLQASAPVSARRRASFVARVPAGSGRWGSRGPPRAVAAPLVSAPWRGSCRGRTRATHAPPAARRPEAPGAASDSTGRIFPVRSRRGRDYAVRPLVADVVCRTPQSRRCCPLGRPCGLPVPVAQGALPGLLAAWPPPCRAALGCVSVSLCELRCRPSRSLLFCGNHASTFLLGI